MSNIITSPNSLEGASYNFNQLVLNGADLNDIKTHRLKTNASLLQKDEWEELDNTVLQVARRNLYAVQDLIDRNLTDSLGGLGTLLASYEKASDMSDADITMSPNTNTEEDTQGFDLASTPIPVVQKDFTLDVRRLKASRNRGAGLDTTQTQTATRKVSEASEKMLVSGADITLDGNKIYGYTNFPDRIQGSAPGAWSDSIDNIYDTVRQMLKDARENGGFRGPFILYVASNLWEELMQRYSDGSGQTAKEAVLEKFDELENIRPLLDMNDGELALVQMTSDVVQLKVAENINTVEWNTQGGFKSHYKVMACWAPQLKSDAKGQTGIVHYTGA